MPTGPKGIAQCDPYEPSYRRARGVLRGALRPGDTPEAAIRRARGDVDAYEDRIAALERSGALLYDYVLAVERALPRLPPEMTGVFGAEWYRTRAALVDAGLLVQEDDDAER